MAWARLDDGFGDHPKVLDLIDTLPELEGAAAIGLWTLALTYAHATQRMAKEPGFIPRSFARSRARVPAYIGDRLVGVGLWEERDGGWFIHDYDDYLPSADLKSKRAEAGKRGAEARWGKAPVNQAPWDAMGRASADGDVVGRTSDEETRSAPDWASEPSKGSEVSRPATPGTDKRGGKTAGADGNLPLFAMDVPSVAIEVPSEAGGETGPKAAPKWPEWVLGSASDKRPKVTESAKPQDAMATCHDADSKKCPEPEPDAMPEPEKVKNTPSSASPPLAHAEAPSVPKQRQPAGADRFEEFYAAYPRKKAPDRARAAWNKAIKGGAEPAVLIGATQRYRDYCKRVGKDPNFLPYPATWLNDGSWRDDLDAETALAGPPVQPSAHQTYRDPEPSVYYDPKARP